MPGHHRVAAVDPRDRARGGTAGLRDPVTASIGFSAAIQSKCLPGSLHPAIRRSLLAARFSLLFLALAFLAGCDTPDLRNVVFKPLTEDPEAYKNALRAYFVTQAARDQPWGNTFLARQDHVLDPDQSPLADLAVKLDGLEARADRKGFLALDRLRVGYHSLEIPAGGQTRRLAIPIQKAHMTMGIFEVGRDGCLVATCDLEPHGFLLTQHFKALGQRHREMKRFLEALQGRPDQAAFADAIAPDYTDSFGGRGDLLKARTLLAQGGELPQLSVQSTLALLDGRKAEVTLFAIRAGRPVMTRLSLVAGAEDAHPWRLSAVFGMNPFDTAAVELAAQDPLPAIKGSVARRKRETEGLGRGLRGSSRGSLFRPEDSGVVERDAFSVPVDRAHPDQSSPDFRIQPSSFGGAGPQSPYAR